MAILSVHNVIIKILQIASNNIYSKRITSIISYVTTYILKLKASSKGVLKLKIVCATYTTIFFFEDNKIFIFEDNNII